MDGGQSGSQDSRKTMDLRGETHISYIREPKVRLLSTLQTRSHIFTPIVLAEKQGNQYQISKPSSDH